MSSFSNFKNIIPIYLITLNALAFLLFGFDKWRAKNHKWRISEFALLFISLIGGATGSLIAMSIFKHKSSKKKFYIGIPILIVFHWLLILYILKL